MKNVGAQVESKFVALNLDESSNKIGNSAILVREERKDPELSFRFLENISLCTPDL